MNDDDEIVNYWPTMSRRAVAVLEKEKKKEKPLSVKGYAKMANKATKRAAEGPAAKAPAAKRRKTEATAAEQKKPRGRPKTAAAVVVVGKKPRGRPPGQKKAAGVDAAGAKNKAKPVGKKAAAAGAKGKGVGVTIPRKKGAAGGAAAGTKRGKSVAAAAGAKAAQRGKAALTAKGKGKGAGVGARSEQQEKAGKGKGQGKWQPISSARLAQRAKRTGTTTTKRGSGSGSRGGGGSRQPPRKNTWAEFKYKPRDWEGNSDDRGSVDSAVLEESICYECGASTAHYGEDLWPTLLLCDRCEGEYHLSCLGLMLAPRNGWICPRCKEEEVEFDKVQYVVDCDQFALPKRKVNNDPSSRRGAKPQPSVTECAPHSSPPL